MSAAVSIRTAADGFPRGQLAGDFLSFALRFARVAESPEPPRSPVQSATSNTVRDLPLAVGRSRL
jgi:hypothetical protein